MTIVYDGEVAHRDSTGQGGIIGPGDAQWMTAASGILHEEFHSPAFAKAGGPFRMVQLWVNLPAKDKMKAPGYQAILDADILVVELGEETGHLRVIAGNFRGTRGPARTFTPVNVWDLRPKGGGSLSLDLPEGHTSAIILLSGQLTVGGFEPAREADMVLLSREGTDTTIDADVDSIALVITGEPIDEPVVGYGPFVMNTQEEIQTAITDFNSGRFGQMPGA
jgi:redox-sensitive bicupin YhaK (pirin superfamily)